MTFKFVKCVVTFTDNHAQVSRKVPCMFQGEKSAPEPGTQDPGVIETSQLPSEREGVRPQVPGPGAAPYTIKENVLAKDNDDW